MSLEDSVKIGGAIGVSLGIALGALNTAVNPDLLPNIVPNRDIGFIVSNIVTLPVIVATFHEKLDFFGKVGYCFFGAAAAGIVYYTGYYITTAVYNFFT